MLRVEGLTVDHGSTPLTFDVAGGACAGLLGRDAGALLRLAETLCGMRAPAGGRVLVNALNITTDDDARAQITVCLPRVTHRVTTIFEHVSTVAAARGAVRLPVADGINRLGVDPRARLTTPAARSAAALLAALVPESRVAVLHDPFNGLDETVRQHAIAWIRSLSESSTSMLITGTEERDVRAVSHAVINVGADR